MNDPIPVSALNHYTFCPRRCALIHVEGVFAENADTLRGRLDHERPDDPGYETREDVRSARALPIFSDRLGLVGKADVVEFRPAPGGGRVPYPVEFKKGRRRSWVNDDVQVCAQALCLEDMFGGPVPAGAIFHIASRRRREVAITAELRAKTLGVIVAVRQLIASGKVPPAVLHPHCEGCSLKPICLPELTARPRRAAQAVERLFVP